MALKTIACVTLVAVLTLVSGSTLAQTPVSPMVLAPDSEVNPPSAHPQVNINVLSDTQGVNLNSYMRALVANLKTTWIAGLEQSKIASPALHGSPRIRLSIQPDGNVSEIHLYGSGSTDLDHVALQAVTQAGPFQPLPEALTSKRLDLEVHFHPPTKALSHP